MPYRKHIWVNGEIIKADLLNNIENGIYNEEQRAMTAESTLDGKITTNKTLADNAIGAEETRARNAEAALTQSIENEEIRATSSEGTLSAQITSETSRATAAEESLRSYVDEKVSTAYKAGGSVFFADLPALAASRLGFVYNIKDAFTTTASFLEGAGKDYPAGSNVGIVEKDEASYEEATVEEGDNPAEMELYELDGTDYVPTEDTSPVSGKTYYELVAVPTYYYDVLAGFIDTSDFITNTDYATTQVAGIVKPDGTTITINNGVISSQGGGGDVSSEEMADVVNILGAKNLIPSKTFRVNVGGMSAVRSENGSIRVYGTSTENEGKFLIESFLSKGTYKIKTSRTNEQDTGVCIIVGEEHYPGYDEVANSASERGFSNTFTLSSDTNVMYGVHVNSGYTIDETFYFMCYPASIEDDSIVPYAKTNRELTSDVEDIQNQQAETKDTLTTDMSSIYSWGVGNLIPPTAKTQTIDGVTFTVNSDRSITVNGTATDDLEYNIADFEIENGDYIFNGYPNGDLPDDPEFDFMCNGHSGCADGSTIQIRHNNASVYIYMEEGSTASNLVFYPMLRPISRTDDTYVPYAKTNRQLTEDMANIASESEAISDIVNVLGAKNLLPNIATTQIVNGVTFTVNSDGSVTANGTSTALAVLSLEGFSGYRADAYKSTNTFSGCADGSTDSYYMYMDYSDDGSSYSGSIILTDGEITIPQHSYYSAVCIAVKSGITLTNKTFYPMIRPANIADDTYVPYAMTNRDLTDNRSYVGMVIHSTTLNTMAKVIAFYGGTTWIQHTGYFLRGATTGVTANSATSTGGADTVTLTVAQMPSHTHTQNAHQHKYGATYQDIATGSSTHYTVLKTKNANTGQGDYWTTATTATNQNTGGGQAHNNVPLYKSVYIWERTV